VTHGSGFYKRYIESKDIFLADRIIADRQEHTSNSCRHELRFKYRSHDKTFEAKAEGKTQVIN